MAELLEESKVVEDLAAVPGWSREGAEIVRLFEFPSYMEGIDFVTRVAQLAEEANHHPDMQVGWRKVTLRFSTHSKGGLTKLDFALARKVDAIMG
ncbi:MAG TPA: 4a-hydroxytetrahydrobiopterin dehydratase [Candidatus Saccharimonadia bacterium]|nr:4a-hydroxytetrahydrobiopterin dehydratase [Candidatus Saccharimonadia bacterium]